MRRGWHEPIETDYAEAWRQFREMHKWHCELLRAELPDRQAIAEVTLLVKAAENRVLKLERLREIR